MKKLSYALLISGFLLLFLSNNPIFTDSIFLILIGISGILLFSGGFILLRLYRKTQRENAGEHQVNHQAASDIKQAESQINNKTLNTEENTVFPSNLSNERYLGPLPTIFEGYDELLEDAARVVIAQGSASIPSLQRQLKVGYSRAARIMDQLEEIKIVGHNEGAAPRKILFVPESYSASYGPSTNSFVVNSPRKQRPVPHYLSKPKLSVPWPPEKYTEILSLHDFCVLDVETTGLDCSNCKVVQIGIIQLINNEPVDFLNTYINPEMHIPSKATEIHGITDDDVKDAPTYKQIADRLFSLLNNGTIIGHNITFDLNFVQHILLESSNPYDTFNINYIDTWEYAYKVLPHMPNYKLQTLLKHYSIDPGIAHTAYDDAQATLELFNALRYEYAHKDEIEAKRKAEELEARRQKREILKAKRIEAFSDSPLFDVRFCFTGDFSIGREAMETLATSVGALVQRNGVNGRTNYLVKGDVSALPDWALDRKLRKAEELSETGKKIKIIEEAEFMHLIADAKSLLKKAENNKTLSFKICPCCGAKNNSNFCVECGTKL